MGLDTLGLLLRVWLWISVPMAVIILLVATWINYLRKIRPKVGLQLAVEGLGGEVLPGGDMLIGRDEVVGAGDPLLVESGEATGGGEAAGGGEEGAREELTATGKETIYRGILWMKEKYEQYREQADLRYERLREELGRSERRYQELLATMEQNKNLTTGMMSDGQRELDVKQGIIDDLELQLRSERMRVEELVVKLQANSQLLMTIYQELDKSFHIGQSIPDLGK
jgi:hypothetical protein